MQAADALSAAPSVAPSTAPVAAGPRTIVVVNSIATGTGAPAGQVSASTDGTTWVTVLNTPDALSGVAHGNGLTVVVGGADGGGKSGSGNAGGGTIRSSTDGATWSDPIPVADALQKVGYGNGGWLAVGAAPEGAGQAAIIYTSPDAVTWAKSPTPTGITGETSVTIDSVAYGQGKWQISYGARAGTGRGFSPLGVATSTDGQSWQIVVPPGGTPTGYSADPVAMDLAFGADAWAFVGYTVADVVADLGSSTSQSGTSTDGTAWTVQQTSLVDTYLDTLVWAGDGEWLARGGLKGGMTGAATDQAVYASTDLVTWTRLGAPGSLIGDLAATRWASIAEVAPSATPGTSAEGTSAAAAPGGGCTDGGLEFRVSRETTFPTCEAMIAQWRSFMATGGTETRQGDWICRLGTSADLGSCALSDTDIFFTVLTAGTTPPATSPTVAAPAGSSYLRTDQSCSSLNQATAEGNAIYAVYRVGGSDLASVCAAVAGSGGYGKWLDDSSPPDARIEC